ncbi:MAG: hypothetical protein E7240_11230 [Lachnospiraceae bacterium]|nr:hypothetical protein [Lachnospiraceae bacterium]
MKKISSYLILAAMVLMTGCGNAQNTAAPAGESGAQPAAETGSSNEADAGKEEEAGREDPAAEAAEGKTGETAADTEAPGNAGGENASSDAGKEQETVTLVIPTVYESVTTQEEAEQIRSENGYESAVLNEDGSLTIVMSRSQHDEMLVQFRKSVDEGIEEIIQAVEDSTIEKIEYNEDYSVFTVTVSGDELGLAERQAADELVMYGTLYHIYSGSDVDRIQVDYVSSGTGEVIETADSGSLDQAY